MQSLDKKINGSKETNIGNKHVLESVLNDDTTEKRKERNRKRHRKGHFCVHTFFFLLLLFHIERDCNECHSVFFCFFLFILMRFVELQWFNTLFESQLTQNRNTHKSLNVQRKNRENCTVDELILMHFILLDPFRLVTLEFASLERRS